MSNILVFILFAVGLVLLIKGGDWFVDGSTGIAAKLNIPEIIIGATVVSIGTTLPEVMVSSLSAAQGAGDVAYGNAIGSIICNTALICSITMIIAPCVADRKTFKTPVIFFFVAAAVYCITAYFFSFTRVVGIILLAIFVVYMFTSVRNALKKEVKAELPGDGKEENESLLRNDIIFLILGAAFIAVGAFLLVKYGQEIAVIMGVPKSVIALTFVALGTSLPELVTAITSLVKGHGALSLGNIVGANMFNLILVSGLSITINPFEVPSKKLFMGHNASLVIDIPLMLLVMVILTIPTLFSQKLRRWQGILLILLYIAYLVFQFAF